MKIHPALLLCMCTSLLAPSHIIMVDSAESVESPTSKDKEDTSNEKKQDKTDAAGKEEGIITDAGRNQGDHGGDPTSMLSWNNEKTRSLISVFDWIASILQWIWEFIFGASGDDDDDDPPVTTPAPNVNTPSPNVSPGEFDPCDPNNSIMYFQGHSEVLSWNASQVALRWIPPLILASKALDGSQNLTGNVFEDAILTYCGGYNYYVFVFEGRVVVEPGLDLEGLIELARTNSALDLIETEDLELVLNDLPPGAEYSFLVKAKGVRGQESNNTAPAYISVAENNAVVRSNFTRVVQVPTPDETSNFELTFNNDTDILTYTGDIPSEIEDIPGNVDVGDYLYVTSPDMVPYILLVEEVITDVANEKSFKVAQLDWQAIFETLDLNGAVLDPVADIDEIDVTDEESATIWEILDSLPEQVTIDICKAVAPDDVAECVSDVQANASRLLREGRRLFFHRKVFKFVKKAVKAVVKVVKKVVDVVKEALDNGIKFQKRLSLIDIDTGERNTVEYNLELAAGFNFYLGAFFRLKVSLSSLEASSGVEGSFGFSGYALIEASVSRSYEPKPKQIYKYEKDQTYFIGPVPVIVTYRAQVDAFFQASATLEGTLFYGFGRSWEYDLTFSYVKGRSPKEFMSTESLVEVDAGVPDPVLEARLGLEAELGFTFEAAVTLYKALEGSLAADVGALATLEVGTDLDAILVTRPYFFTLNEFGVDITVSVRIFVGLSGALAAILNDILSVAAGDDGGCGFEIGPVEFPEFDEEEEASPIEEAYDAALESDFGPGGLVTVGDLVDAAGVTDEFDAAVGAISSFVDGNFGFNFVIFDESFNILSIPEIELVAVEDSFEICSGPDAIRFKVSYDLDQSIIATGIKASKWYANFDGEYFPLQDDSPWLVGGESLGDATVRLPRSGTTDEYDLDLEDATIFLRATADLLPIVPFGMIASASLAELFEDDFEDFESFDCCDDEDCLFKFGDVRPVCSDDRVCLLAPSAMPSATPSLLPSGTPSSSPTDTPSAQPSSSPSSMPSSKPSAFPTVSMQPSSLPSTMPSMDPTAVYFEELPPRVIVYGKEGFFSNQLVFQIEEDTITRPKWFDDANFPCGVVTNGARSRIEFFYVAAADEEIPIDVQCNFVGDALTIPRRFAVNLDFNVCNDVSWTQDYKVVFYDQERLEENQPFPTDITACADAGDVPPGFVTCEAACTPPSSLRAIGFFFLEENKKELPEFAIKYDDPRSPTDFAAVHLLNDDAFLVRLGFPATASWDDATEANFAFSADAQARMLQRFAMLSFYYYIDESSRPPIVNTTIDIEECMWSPLVTCNIDGFVTELKFPKTGPRIAGGLTPEIGNLNTASLKVLDFGLNTQSTTNPSSNGEGLSGEFDMDLLLGFEELTLVNFGNNLRLELFFLCNGIDQTIDEDDFPNLDDNLRVDCLEGNACNPPVVVNAQCACCICAYTPDCV